MLKGYDFAIFFGEEDDADALLEEAFVGIGFSIEKVFLNANPVIDIKISKDRKMLFDIFDITTIFNLHKLFRFLVIFYLNKLKQINFKQLNSKSKT
jgi:hypothetical protein